MRRLIVASVILLSSCTFTVGQDVAELAIIRSLLGVPENTPVTSTSSATVPKDAPLKVYLDVSGDTTERDKKVKDSLVQWMDEWGKGDTTKRTTLEVVPDPGAARVALIHFTDFPTDIGDPGQDERRQPGSVNSNSSAISMTMMVYTYIIVKEPNNLKILYRRKVPLLTRSTIVAGPQLSNAVTAKLRKEIDKEIEKRAMKSRVEKDAKRPDYKLRDEFARWMTSEDSSLKSQ